jgi:hypothetical protein
MGRQEREIMGLDEYSGTQLDMCNRRQSDDPFR